MKELVTLVYSDLYNEPTICAELSSLSHLSCSYVRRNQETVELKTRNIFKHEARIKNIKYVAK
jgi:hypothetical protein